VLLHIGFDDTDSPSGGCTTYIAARLIDVLSGLGARFVDYPNLLRLNPNVPWKTRGNGAVCLRVEIDNSREEDTRKYVLKLVESYADFDCDNTNPGVVFLAGEVPSGLTEFSETVVTTVVSLDDALALAEEHGASAIGFKNMRGIIGGLAAVGGLQRGDHTYEFLGYRLPGSWGTPRRVDPESVVRMDEAGPYRAQRAGSCSLWYPRRGPVSGEGGGTHGGFRAHGAMGGLQDESGHGCPPRLVCPRLLFEGV
jgi:tRNA(Ile2)-agmatinylcytidine synthase